VKYIVLLFLLLSLNFQALAADNIFKASISRTWTVDTASREAQRVINTESYPQIDPDYITNRQAINAGKKTLRLNKDFLRCITTFSWGGYSIGVIDLTGKTDYPAFKYNNAGSLQTIIYDYSLQEVRNRVKNAVEIYGESITKDLNSLKSYFYPTKMYEYAFPSGELISITLTVGENDQYSFKVDGTLESHWLNDKCYTPDGTHCGTRKSYIY